MHSGFACVASALFNSRPLDTQLRSLFRYTTAITLDLFNAIIVKGATYKAPTGQTLSSAN